MFSFGRNAIGADKVRENRNLNEEIKFRVTYEKKQQILAAAQSQNKVVSDILRQALRDYIDVDEIERKKSAIQSYVLAAKVAAEALRNYILYSNGDADADLGGLLLSTAKAAAVIGSVPWLVRWLYRLGTEIALEVSGPGGISPSDPTYGNFMQSVSTLPLVLILVAMVLIALIYIQTFIRAAHLGMLAVIGPIVAIGLVGSNSSNVFNLWVRELVVVCFSQALQVFMLMAALYALGSIMTGNTVTALLMFVGWLWSTMKAPSVLKQMLYSSGLDSVAGGAAQSAGTMVLVRKMMTRGV